MTKSRIYTKSGDKGFTSLVSGNRVLKSNIRLDAYGTIDELNSFIACLINEVNDADDCIFLQRIQSNLFLVGGYLANDLETRKESICREEIEQLEQHIDAIDEALPSTAKGFILPGGSRGSAAAHVCRTVCRRAERTIYRLKEKADVEAIVLEYVNRLSDYFFLFAKKQNFVNGVDEIIWENPCK